jgi:hypothetical protein
MKPALPRLRVLVVAAALHCGGTLPGGGRGETTLAAPAATAACPNLAPYVGAYVHPAYRKRVFDREDALARLGKEPPPDRATLVLLTILPDGGSFAAAWMPDAKHQMRLSSGRGLTSVQMNGTDAILRVGSHRARIGVEHGVLTLSGLAMKDDSAVDLGLPWQGESAQLVTTEHAALCAKTAHCDAALGPGSVCTSNIVFPSVRVCVPHAALAGKLVRDDLVGGYVLAGYADRRLDNDLDAAPREGRDGPVPSFSMMTLLPSGRFHIQWWTSTTAKPKQRAPIWMDGVYDVVQREGQAYLYLATESFGDWTATGLEPDGILDDAKFAVTRRHADMILTGAPAEAGDPPGLYRENDRNRVGETLTLLRRKDAVLCGMTSDCDDPERVCASSAAHGLGWCVDVRAVPHLSPPHTMPELAGSYAVPRIAGGVSANERLLGKLKAGEASDTMLTLLPDGKFRGLFQRGASTAVDEGKYIVEHGQKRGATLRLTFKKSGRVDPYGVEPTAGGVKLTHLVRPCRKCDAKQVSFELTRTEHTALCQTHKDCALLSVTHPGARWLCEAHNVAGDDPVSVCVDAATRGHQRVPPRLACE